MHNIKYIECFFPFFTLYRFPISELGCPVDANTYIHRAGRTARYHRGGESLLVLLPSEEQGMVEELNTKKIPFSKIK
jgi:ATP-dependent RNA helicase DDX10/DBP4